MTNLATSQDEPSNLVNSSILSSERDVKITQVHHDMFSHNYSVYIYMNSDQMLIGDDNLNLNANLLARPLNF